MRIHVEDEMARKVGKVYCDGEVLKRCFLFDTEAGKAWCYDTNHDGKVYLDDNGELPIVEHSGRITVTWKDVEV